MDLDHLFRIIPERREAETVSYNTILHGLLVKEGEPDLILYVFGKSQREGDSFWIIDKEALMRGLYHPQKPVLVKIDDLKARGMTPFTEFRPLTIRQEFDFLSQHIF